MIQFIIPPFYGFRAPCYRHDGGPPLPAVTPCFPALTRSLHRLLTPFDDCRRLARNYRHLQFLAWFTGGCAGINFGLGILVWRYFGFTTLFPNAVALLLLAIAFSYIAYRQFHLLAAALTRHWRENPQPRLDEEVFRHYDVTPHGIFLRPPPNSGT